jgi:hypothetical protein
MTNLLLALFAVVDVLHASAADKHNHIVTTHLLERGVVRASALESQKLGDLDLVLLALEHTDAKCVAVKFRHLFVLFRLIRCEAGEEVDGLADEDALELLKEPMVLKGLSGNIEPVNSSTIWVT